jgi:GNAT superfamily N-acetyltransferase
MAGLTIRPATAGHLAVVADIFYESQLDDNRHGLPRCGVPSLYQYELETGELYVAERASEGVAFAGLIQRGGVAFLADLFVRAPHRSSGIGARLLRQILPCDGRPCCTLSSGDPRALALYTRSGMLPRWPHFQLGATLRDLGPWPDSPVQVVEAAVGDPELVRWDTEISGRCRPGDHRYWVERRGGTPLWFVLHGERVGYGYAQTYSDDLLRDPDTITLGPIGTRAATHATACVGAAVSWASARGATARIAIPGLHPALSPLLNVGFKITEVETFCSTVDDCFADVGCYVSSGSDLF